MEVTPSSKEITMWNLVACTVLLYKKDNSGQIWFKLSLNKNSKQ